jgi:hypothetical protein
MRCIDTRRRNIDDFVAVLLSYRRFEAQELRGVSSSSSSLMLEYDLIEAWAAWVKTNVDVVDPGRHGQASRALVAGVSNNEGQIWAPVETFIVT